MRKPLSSPTYEIRPANDVAELEPIYKIEQDEYGADAIMSFATVISWWQRYPYGSFRLFKGSKIIGGLGLWPLSDAAYIDLIEGRLDERQLTVDHLVDSHAPKALAHWYLGDIILDKSVRQTREHFALRLLVGGLKSWLSVPNLASTLTVCALIYSGQGNSLARRLGFSLVGRTPDGYEIHRLTASRQHIKQEIEKLETMIKPSGSS